jgi:hypothetical protein
MFPFIWGCFFNEDSAEVIDTDVDNEVFEKKFYD